MFAFSARLWYTELRAQCKLKTYSCFCQINAISIISFGPLPPIYPSSRLFFLIFFSLRPTLSYLIAQNGPQKWGPTTFCVIYLAYGRIRVLSLFLLLLSSLSGFNDEDDEARKYFKTILCKCFPCSCFKRVAIAGDKRQKKGKRRPPQQRMGPDFNSLLLLIHWGE